MAEPVNAAAKRGDGERFGAAEHLPELSPRERRKVEQQSRPTAALIHETIRAEGEGELERGTLALFISGVAAGLSMGFSLVVEGFIQVALPDEPWRELVASFGYCFGFLVVVLGRQQLFTENTLTPVLPLLYNRDLRTLGNLGRLWSVVLVANMLGALLFAVALTKAMAFPPGMEAAFVDISQHAPVGAFSQVYVKGVLAGWLIALMAWLLPASGSARPFIIILVTWVVAIGGLAHIVAGSVEIFYLLLIGRMEWAQFVPEFFLPTLLGNITGGVALVAMFNYGQVAEEVGAAGEG